MTIESLKAMSVSLFRYIVFFISFGFICAIALVSLIVGSVVAIPATVYYQRSFFKLNFLDKIRLFNKR